MVTETDPLTMLASARATPIMTPEMPAAAAVVRVATFTRTDVGTVGLTAGAGVVVFWLAGVFVAAGGAIQTGRLPALTGAVTRRPAEGGGTVAAGAVGAGAPDEVIAALGMVVEGRLPLALLDVSNDTVAVPDGQLTGLGFHDGNGFGF